jgi:hypothetical protein
MTRTNPNDRPTATEALAELETVVSSISQRKLHSRIWRTEDTTIQRFGRFIIQCLGHFIEQRYLDTPP